MNDADDLDDLERELGPSLRVALRRIATEITERAPTTPPRAIDHDPVPRAAENGANMVDLQRSTRTAAPRERRRPRLRTAAVVAAAAAVVVAIIAVALSPFDHENPADKRAEAAAESFMKAWTGADGNAVTASLSPDAHFDGWTPATLPALHDWFQAMGWQYEDKGCQVMSPERVWCDYTVENDLTRAFGRQPVTASFVLVLDGATVKSVQDDLNGGAYRDIWTAFSDWVEAHHPDDINRMYALAGGYARPDPISIALWKRYTGEFVESGDAYVARARAICTAAHQRYDGLVAASASTQAAPPDAADRVLHDALAELQALAPPAAVRHSFEIGFSLIDELVGAIGQLPADAPPSTADEGLRSPLAQLPHLEIGLERCAINPLAST